MSEFVKRQEEAKANLISQVRSIIDQAETEGRGLEATDQETITRIEGDIDAAQRAIEVAQRNEERTREAVEAAGNFTPVEKAHGEADIFRSLARGEVREHTFSHEKRATLVPTVNTVPVGFLDQVFEIARLVGPALETSNVITRASGESLRIPKLNVYSVATQKAAGAALDDSDPTFDSLLLTPFKQGFIVKIASELVTDSGFNIEQVIQEQAGNAIGFQVNSLATTGAGTTEPLGLATASATGVTAAETSFTADDLIDLAHSVDGAVRRLPGTAFVCNTATLGAIRKLKDDNGNYIYNPQASGPDQLLGFPVVENPAVADIGAEEKSVLFGHLPSYVIVTTGLDVAVSSDAFFANDIIGYRFTYRFDGNLTHDAHVKALVHAAAA